MMPFSSYDSDDDAYKPAVDEAIERYKKARGEPALVKMKKRVKTEPVEIEEEEECKPRRQSMRRKVGETDRMAGSTSTDLDCKETRIVLDAKFTSYADFESALNHFKTCLFHPFRVASSETLRNSSGSVDSVFKYRYIVFHCVHYGMPRQRGVGTRPNQKYLALGCRAMLRINFNYSEKCLRITTLRTKHTGHEHSEDAYMKTMAKIGRKDHITPTPLLSRRAKKRIHEALIKQNEQSDSEEATTSVRRAPVNKRIKLEVSTPLARPQRRCVNRASVRADESLVAETPQPPPELVDAQPANEERFNLTGFKDMKDVDCLLRAIDTVLKQPRKDKSISIKEEIAKMYAQESGMDLETAKTRLREIRNRNSTCKRKNNMKSDRSSSIPKSARRVTFDEKVLKMTGKDSAVPEINKTNSKSNAKNQHIESKQKTTRNGKKELLKTTGSRIYMGASFNSFAEFEPCLEEYKRAGFHPLRIASSESLKDENGDQDATMKYRYVVYHCAHFGDPRLRGASKKKGLTYLPCGCRAMLRLCYDYNKRELRITSLKMEHSGHEVSERNFRMVKERRSINGTPTSTRPVRAIIPPARFSSGGRARARSADSPPTRSTINSRSRSAVTSSLSAYNLNNLDEKAMLKERKRRKAEAFALQKKRVQSRIEEAEAENMMLSKKLSVPYEEAIKSFKENKDKSPENPDVLLKMLQNHERIRRLKKEMKLYSVKRLTKRSKKFEDGELPELFRRSDNKPAVPFIPLPAAFNPFAAVGPLLPAMDLTQFSYMYDPALLINTMIPPPQSSFSTSCSDSEPYAPSAFAPLRQIKTEAAPEFTATASEDDDNMDISPPSGLIKPEPRYTSFDTSFGQIFANLTNII